MKEASTFEASTLNDYYRVTTNILGSNGRLTHHYDFINLTIKPELISVLTTAFLYS